MSRSWSGASDDPILAKYLRGLLPRYRRASRLVVRLNYPELVAIVHQYNPHRPPIAWAASLMACATVGKALGATRMEDPCREGDLLRLRGFRSKSIWVSAFSALGPIFDHSFSFFAGRRVIGILTRPYQGSEVVKQAMELARDPELSIWSLPTELCSWYPGWTISYLITPVDGPDPGLGFERLTPPPDIPSP